MAHVGALADYDEATWRALPFRFHRHRGLDRVIVTNFVGEHVALTSSEFDQLSSGTLTDGRLIERLRGCHIIRRPGDELPLELLAMKVRTRNRRLADFTALHLFVVTLRCEHACGYCQVSRQGSGHRGFDMTAEAAERALDLVFLSTSPSIKIELQGGEPLLNFERIEQIVEGALRRNIVAQRNLAFVITSNLALLDDKGLDFCHKHGMSISTSLDGPEALHNKNRPRPGGDSWARAVAGIGRAQQALGPNGVSAVMTTTLESLDVPVEIIDTYLGLGLRNVFLRPISPYGFAVRSRAHTTYDATQWLAFFEQGLDHIIELNRRGEPMMEQLSAIVLKKMLTNDDPGYVDLMSPAGIGLGALVYNYDGDVYASDEARMLAEMGDTTFRLGNVMRDSYEDIVLNDVLLDHLDTSFAASAPMCCDCAFQPFCGADPVFHHAVFGDPLGVKPMSAFCRRNTGVFEALLERYHSDPFARTLFHQWAGA
jgi:uncharacterized protein